MIESDSEDEHMSREEEESDDDQIQSISYERDVDGIPIWRKNRRLSDYPARFRSEMYLKKVSKSKQGMHKLFICERAMNMADFEPFGVVRSFRRLGWEANMVFNNDDNEEVYMDQTVKWMSTLEKIPGENPPLTTQLVGVVEGRRVVLSFDTMRTLGNFDTGAENDQPYHYPTDAVLAVQKAEEESWKRMIRELFEVPLGQDISSMILHREKLKVFPRLLLPFVTSNVMPRVSDKEMVRLPDILVLYALVTGHPALSARHLIMYNVWEARERQARMSIPHARLLTKLLRKQGAVNRNTRGTKIKHIPWKMSTFVKSSVWKYRLTPHTHRLHCTTTGQVLEVRRDDVEGEPGDEEGDEEEEEQGVNPPHLLPPIVTGFTSGQYSSPYYVHLQDQISQSRPNTFDDWNEGTRMMYDRQSQELEEARLYRRAMAQQQELYRNQDFHYHEAIRHERDYERGWHYTVRPEPTNWTDPNREPYEVTHQIPRSPQAVPSSWISPFTQQQAGSSASGSSFQMGDLERGLMESIFGTPYQPPPYDG
jgi:hypothetical protein